MTAGDWSLYPYNPVKPLPYFFAIVIFLLAIVNVWQNFFKYRWKKFGFIMTWASTVWIAGFICRAISQYETQNIGLFIAQYVLILVGPPLYAASETFILGRLLAYLPYHAPIHPGRVLSTFVIISAAIEALAANGAARLAGAGADEPSQRKLGYSLVEAGLLMQAALEIAFFSITSYLWYKCRQGKTLPKNVLTMILVLLLTSMMMLVRCIVRVVEAFEAAGCDITAPGYDGYCGYASRHEWILYVFEIANITVFVIALTIFTPGAYLPHSDKVFLDQYDGRTERLGPGFSKADKRPLLITVVDPFDFYGIMTGKGRTLVKFWEERHPEYVGQEVHDTRQKGAESSSEEESRKEAV